MRAIKTFLFYLLIFFCFSYFFGLWDNVVKDIVSMPVPGRWIVLVMFVIVGILAIGEENKNWNCTDKTGTIKDFEIK